MPKPEPGLTERQGEVVRMISHLTEAKGYPPTVRELGAALGLSNQAVADHLRVLRRKEWVTWEHGQPRTLRVIQ